jgi:putative phosphoesterase
VAVPVARGGAHDPVGAAVRLGLISDIHGNALALDAVLAELEEARVDRLVCLGDVAVGPQAVETLERVRELGCPVVLGNWDAFYLGARPAAETEVARMLAEIADFWGEALTDEHRAFIETFVPRLDLHAGATDVVCVHGSPKSYDDWIFSTTPDEELAELLAGVPARALVLGGHTHVQMVRRHERLVVVNPGSVGMPFLDSWPRSVRIGTWAEYGVVTVEDGRLALDLHRTSYDADAFLRVSRESGMPHADWWLGTWID